MERAELARLLGGRAAGRRDVVVAEAAFAPFRSAFAEAVAGSGRVFLTDPGWGAVERGQFETLRGLETVGGGARGWLLLPTGGSSGRMKLARHGARTIGAAVAGFAAHFGVRRVNVIGLLPLYHVGGFMAWMRAVMTGGEFLPWDWRRLAAGARPPVPDGEWFLSLVPTQLQRLLEDAAAVEWLRRFRAVFIGGGPSWAELMERGAEARLPLAFSYGMTETAAMVAALRPEEFLAGRRNSGRALPHARLAVADDGVITVESASLFLGYHPGAREAGPWRTEDLGTIDADGFLTVAGRRDGLIISGGKKIDPGEVEAALRATGFFADVAVIGWPDEAWGERVVACVPEGAAVPDEAAVKAALGGVLAAHKRPKTIVAVTPWPRNALGKINRAALAEALRGVLG